MTANMQRRDALSSTPPPPTPEEHYWDALLNEGEYAASVPVYDQTVPDTAYLTSPLAQKSTSLHTPASDWEALRALVARDDVFELTVQGHNRGGLLVEWRSLRGFVPASQLLEFPASASPIMRQKALMARIGHVLCLRVIELDEAQNRLIFSERAARAAAGGRADMLSRLRPGDRTSGTVTNVCDFGVFVDLGGLEGLIHISELSWGRVSHPSDILKRGAQVEVLVLDVKPDAGRIALSLKRLYPDPWESVHLRFQVGELVRGTITNVVDFGAFARIDEGLEGLIHVSELAEGQFLHPRNVVSEGQEITARILSIDGRARRLGLTLRNSQP
jgi:small subunit ribosomal protein S1